MPLFERIKQTVIIASAFGLLIACDEVAIHLVMREPLDRRFWHSLVSIERLLGGVPIYLLFGWNYPVLMRRAADRKAKAGQTRKIVVQIPALKNRS